MRKADEAHRDALRAERERLEREWEEAKRLAQEADEPEPSKSRELLEAEQRETTYEVGNEEGGAVQPNWDESPIEVSRMTETVERTLTVSYRRFGGEIIRYSRTLKTRYITSGTCFPFVIGTSTDPNRDCRFVPNGKGF